MSVHDEIDLAKRELDSIELRKKLLIWVPVGLILVVFAINILWNLLT